MHAFIVHLNIVCLEFLRQGLFSTKESESNLQIGTALMQ